MYSVHGKKFRRPSAVVMLAAAVVVVALLGLGLHKWYERNLGPVSSNQSVADFTVSPGDSRDQIAANLENAHLIRSQVAFINYIRSNHIGTLQAGTYELKQSMSVRQIVNKLKNGDVAKNLLTILPAKRLDQIRAMFIASGYTADQVDAALDPGQYRDMPLLASLPPGATLEGFLYPDSYQKDAATPAATIVRESLDELNGHLTPDVLSGFSAQGLSVYRGVTLASIVAQESDDATAQPTIAQVFSTRLKQGIPLGSDVTAFYASSIAGISPSVTIESLYNTRIHPGLTPGPIGNVTDSALKAVAHPAGTDYLFFLAGDDDKIYFSHTQAEQDANARAHCQKKCAL
jgi:UPF0755 protein